MRGAGAEECGGDAKVVEGFGVAHDFVVRFGDVGGAGVFVGGAAGDGEGDVAGAVVGDFEEGVVDEFFGDAGVVSYPALVEEEGGFGVVFAEDVDDVDVVAEAVAGGTV